MIKKSKIVQKPYKKDAAFLYALWCSIPLLLRELPESKLKKWGYDSGDTVFMKLLRCETKSDFSRTFNVSIKQLKRWDESKAIQKKIEDINLKNNVLRFKKDIDFHFTQKTIREADASRVKLWKQLYEGWREKSEIKSYMIDIDQDRENFK